jgi:hypothetical protein
VALLFSESLRQPFVEIFKECQPALQNLGDGGRFSNLKHQTFSFSLPLFSNFKLSPSPSPPPEFYGPVRVFKVPYGN